MRFHAGMKACPPQKSHGTFSSARSCPSTRTEPVTRAAPARAVRLRRIQGGARGPSSSLFEITPSIGTGEPLELSLRGLPVVLRVSRVLLASGAKLAHHHLGKAGERHGA